MSVTVSRVVIIFSSAKRVKCKVAPMGFLSEWLERRRKRAASKEALKPILAQGYVVYYTELCSDCCRCGETVTSLHKTYTVTSLNGETFQKTEGTVAFICYRCRTMSSKWDGSGEICLIDEWTPEKVHCSDYKAKAPWSEKPSVICPVCNVDLNCEPHKPPCQNVKP